MSGDELEAEGGPRPSRRDTVSEAELSPQSLVGSWFHRVEGGDLTEQGIVLAQVQAEPLDVMFLVESNGTQRLVKLQSMFPENDHYEYRFYDTDDQMREAYAEWVVRKETA